MRRRAHLVQKPNSLCSGRATGEQCSSSKGPERDVSAARDQDSETSLRTVVPFCGKKPGCIVKVVLIHMTVIQ